MKEENKPDNGNIVIIINGREKEVDSKKISYEQIIFLAFGDMSTQPEVVYTITYSKGKKVDKGSMVKGDTITIKQGMVFNVTRTDRS